MLTKAEFEDLQNKELEELAHRQYDLEFHRGLIQDKIDKLEHEINQIDNELDFMETDYDSKAMYTYKDFLEDKAFDDWKGNR